MSVDAVQYLSQAYRLNRRIEFMANQAKEMRQLAECVGGAGFEQTRSGTKPNEAPFAKVVASLIEQERKNKDCMEELIALRDEITQSINTVSDSDMRLVLQLRYLEGKSMSAIAAEIHVCKATVKRWHRAAIECIRIPNGKVEPK